MAEYVKLFFGPLISIVEKVVPALRERWVGQAVKYGDTIRLVHVVTKHALHSHGQNYTHPNSSRQQMVTAYSSYDSNDFWLVKGKNGLSPSYKNGQVVRNKDVIRLEHVETKRNLHSHTDAPSPLTSQQEVTAFGDKGEGDSNDDWRVEVMGSGVWHEKKQIRLIHVNTKCALHSHSGHSHPVFTLGQQEVTCYKDGDNNDLWVVGR